MKWLFLAVTVIAAGASAWSVACLDMTPLAPPPDAAAPPPIVDAGPDAPDVDTRPPCERCIETPEDAGGCATDVAACVADTTCAAIYACAVKQGCFGKGTPRAGITCGIPCAQSAGVSDPSNPAVTLIYNIVTCASASCNGICFPEAGAPADAGAPD